MERKNYNQIQCLRGLAAILVLLFHFAPQLERYGLSYILPGIEKWGFWGVDIFFVLSGFVIALSAEKLSGLKDSRNFIIKRSLRIFLGYWPALMLWIAVTIYLGNTIQSSLFLTSWLLLSGSMADHILPIAWSLYFELTFYIFFTFLILFASPSRRPALIQFFALMIFVWCAVWILVWPSDVMSGGQPLRGVISAYAIEFFTGIMIYRARSYLASNMELIAPLSIASMTLLIVGTQSHWFDKVEILRMGTYGLAAAAIVSLAVCLEEFKYSKILNKIGNASYSLYLTHIVIIDLTVSTVNTKIGLTTDSGRALVLSIPVTAIIFALIWYRIIEKPLYQKTIAFLNPRLTRNNLNPDVRHNGVKEALK